MHSLLRHSNHWSESQRFTSYEKQQKTPVGRGGRSHVVEGFIFRWEMNGSGLSHVSRGSQTFMLPQLCSCDTAQVLYHLQIHPFYRPVFPCSGSLRLHPETVGGRRGTPVRLTDLWQGVTEKLPSSNHCTLKSHR